MGETGKKHSKAGKAWRKTTRQKQTPTISVNTIKRHMKESTRPRKKK